MSILNSNEIGAVYMKINEYYEVSAASLRYTKYSKMINEILNREYPIESIPTPRELYREIIAKLKSVGLTALLVPSNIEFVSVHLCDDEIGWIYILHKT